MATEASCLVQEIMPLMVGNGVYNLEGGRDKRRLGFMTGGLKFAIVCIFDLD